MFVQDIISRIEKARVNKKMSEGGDLELALEWDQSLINHRIRVGLRTDIWRMKIKFGQNNSCSDNNPSCLVFESRVTMIQPTVLLSWRFLPKINTSVAFGWEFNISTSGRYPLGEGSILLIGLGFQIF